MTVKIAPLLAHYLYTNKRLDLPGIGTFLLDNSVSVEQENSKQSKNIELEGVSFESNTSIKEPSEDLIQYISTHSGRIKPLAAADLDSYLWLALQFINIGKPYLIEGIGSLTKINSGGFDFVPGQVLTEKLKDIVAKEAENMASRSADDNYKNIFYPKKSKTNWKKPVAVLLILAGIALAIWGGYTVYKKTSDKKDSGETNTDINKKKENISQPDTATIPKDSVIDIVQKIPEGKNKFILEVSDRSRAMQRYNKLKNYLWDVQIETKDSVSYQVFMLLPVTGADTTRVKDSLSMLNGKRVYIER
jgi:hypothetical protein